MKPVESMQKLQTVHQQQNIFTGLKFIHFTILPLSLLTYPLIHLPTYLRTFTHPFFHPPTTRLPSHLSIYPSKALSECRYNRHYVAISFRWFLTDSFANCLKQQFFRHLVTVLGWGICSSQCYFKIVKEVRNSGNCSVNYPFIGSI